MFRMKITDTLHVDVLVARISKKKRIWKKIWREIKTHFHLIQYHSISQILVMVTQNERNRQRILAVSITLHLSGVFSCMFFCSIGNSDTLHSLAMLSTGTIQDLT